MPTLVQFDTPSGPILIETTGDVAVTAVSSTPDGVVAKAEQQLRESLSSVTALANEFGAALKGIQGCSGAQLAFGLDVSGKGTIYVVETTAKASFSVTLKFDIPAGSARP